SKSGRDLGSGQFRLSVGPCGITLGSRKPMSRTKLPLDVSKTSVVQTPYANRTAKSDGSAGDRTTPQPLSLRLIVSERQLVHRIDHPVDHGLVALDVTRHARPAVNGRAVEAPEFFDVVPDDDCDKRGAWRRLVEVEEDLLAPVPLSKSLAHRGNLAAHLGALAD